LIDPKSDSAAESLVDNAIRDHFRNTEDSAPDFNQMWRAAMAEPEATQRLRPAFAISALAACAALVMAVSIAVYDPDIDTDLPLPAGAQVSMTDREALLNELAVSTRWRAPSDGLLESESAIDVWGLPQFDWSNQLEPEETPWL